MAKGVAFLAPLIALLLGSAVVLGGALVMGMGNSLQNATNISLLTNHTNISNASTLDDLTNFTIDTATSIPFSDLWDYLASGVTGVFRWLGNVFAGAVQLVMRLWIPDAVIPVWFGWVITAMMLLWLVKTRFTWFWEFFYNKIWILIMILAIVFIAGVILKYIGAIA